MKKSFFLLSLSAILLCLSCKKSGTEPTPEPEPQPETPALVLNSTSFDIQSEGGDATLSIKGNYPWKITITNQPNWLTISQLEGTGDKDIKLTTALHQGIDARSVSLKLSSSHEKIDDQTITLTQQSQLNWYKHLRNNTTEFSKTVIQDTDGGLIILSNTGYSASSKMWVTKISADGKTTVWAKEIGTGYGASIIKTSGGFIIGGRRYNEFSPMQFIKLSADGSTIEWQNLIGTQMVHYEVKALAPADGGFVVSANRTDTEDDVYIAKISENGQSIVWDRTINKANIEFANALVPTNDGYIIGNIAFDYNYFTHLTKISLDGQTELWEKSFHQIQLHEMKDLIPTTDGFLLMGIEANGNTKIAKIDVTGQNLIWEKSIPTEENEKASAITIIEDGYMLASHKLLINNPTNFSLSKLSSDGQNILWKKTINSGMRVNAMLQTSNGFILAGDGSERNNYTAYICQFKK